MEETREDRKGEDKKEEGAAAEGGATTGGPKKRFHEKCIDCLKPEQEEETVEGEQPKREEWNNRFTFFISTLGMSVGLGHIWRFPTLAYKMGGGTFLIMYLIMIGTIGNVLYFFEIANGQYSSKNCFNVFDKCPIIQGVGYSMIIYAYLFCVYYNNMVGFSLYYFFSCFTSRLPWTYCPNENDTFYDPVKCVPYNPDLEHNMDIVKCGGKDVVYNRTRLCANDTDYSTQVDSDCKTQAGDKPYNFNVTDLCRDRQYPSYYFWSHFATQEFRQTDPMYGYLGQMHWALFGCLILAWFLNYASLYKGLKSMKIIMYIMVPLPYIVLFLMLGIALAQEGSTYGIKQFFTPKLSSFINIEDWRIATEQAFYSLGVAMGPLITFGSYANFDSPCHIDAALICFCIALTSILCASVVFAVLGFLATQTHKPFDEIAEIGPGLVFIVYPEALDLLPGATFFSLLFYIMLINIGSSSVSSIVETFSSAIYDLWPNTRRKKYLVNLVVCVSAFLCGVPICLRGGLVYYDLFDTYSAGMTLLPICAFELLGIVFIYGLGRFCEDMAFMLGYYPGRYYRYLWTVGPFILLIISIYGIAIMEIPTEWKTWAIVFGWMLYWIVMGPIPVTMIVKLVLAYRHENMREAIDPVEGHGPKDEKNKQFRSLYVHNRPLF